MSQRKMKMTLIETLIIYMFYMYEMLLVPFLFFQTKEVLLHKTFFSGRECQPQSTN